MDKVLSVIFMVGVLVLVLPAFLKSNSTLKLFLKNLSIWALNSNCYLGYCYIFSEVKT